MAWVETGANMFRVSKNPGCDRSLTPQLEPLAFLASPLCLLETRNRQELLDRRAVI